MSRKESWQVKKDVAERNYYEIHYTFTYQSIAGGLPKTAKGHYIASFFASKKDAEDFFNTDPDRPEHSRLGRIKHVPVITVQRFGYHEHEVDQAVKEGKPVPDEVLADYPEIRERYGFSFVKKKRDTT